MDINLGRLAAYVRLDFSKLKGDQDRASKGIKDFSKRLTREVGASFTDLGSKMSLGVTAPLLALGKAAVTAAKDFDSLKRGLTAVSGSSQEAERQLKRLKEIAKLPGLSFNQAIEGSTRLQAAGLSAQLAERSLKAFGNALATVGKGSAELEGVNLALSQIASKGKVSAEEINQIAERVPQIRQAMLRIFGTADTEVLQRAKITSQQFLQAIVGELEKAPQVVGGVANSFENFNQSMQDALAELGKAILPDLMKAMKEIEEGVKSFIGWWTKLPEGTRQNIIRFAEFAAVAGPLILTLGSMANAVNALATAFGALKIASIGARGGIIGVIAAAGALAIGKVANDLTMSIGKGREDMYKNDAARRVSDPNKYWRDYINAAKQRIATQSDPAIIAANRRMIANAERQLRGDLSQKGGVMGPPAPTQAQRLQSQLQAQLRAQIAAGQQEAAARKAEIARNKAEAEARRRQSARERRESLLDRVMQNADRGGQGLLDSFLSDMIGQFRESEAARKLRGKGSERFGIASQSLSAAMNLLPEMLKKAQQASAAKFQKGVGKGSGMLGGAFDAFSSAMGALSPTAQKVAEQVAVRRIALEDRIAAHSVRMGRLSLEDYQAYLQKRLLDTQDNIEEQMRLEADLQEVTFRRMEEEERKRSRGWQNLARGLENVFASAFYDVLASGKDFFQSLLDGFKQMIAQMIAAALAAGLIRSLFGGNFLTGFFGALGFDSAANDATAHRWGRDFSRHFTSGAMEHSRQRAVQGGGRMAMAGAGAVNVNVHLGGVVVNHPMDFRQIEEQISLAARNALRRNV